MSPYVAAFWKEATALGLTRVERLVFICAAAFLLVFLKVAGRKIGAALVAAAKNMEPQQVMDEGGPQPEGQEFPTDRPPETESGSGG